ncbi:MAG: hypothetical protein KKF44_07345 [Nanoarchaeota archaeon]|nr:hypothetical protein [Nanoarchaeota archaeon]
MLENVSYYQILGRPLIYYMGVVTLLLLIFTASIPFLVRKKVKGITFKHHKVIAKITVTFAILHGLLAGLTYL